MAKAVKAVKAVPPAAAQEVLPKGILIIQGAESAAPDSLVAAVLAGWRKKRSADSAKIEVDAANDALIEMLEEPCSVVIPGVCRASYSVREMVKVVDAERLGKILGPRYIDLVKEAVSYKPEARLVEMAADGDEPLQPAIASCLAVSSTDAITWRAEKPE